MITDNQEKIIDLLEVERFDYLFIDLFYYDENFKKKLNSFKKKKSAIQIIVLTDQENIRQAVREVKKNAADYLTYPVNAVEIGYVIDTIYENQLMKSELDHLRKEFWKTESLEIINTRSPMIKKLFDKISYVSPTHTSVLLNGETGSGKNVIAKLIHDHSNRSENKFISLHCGAIPDTLIESELFGHEKGAFTGAVRRKLGKFEIANKGTIFLDEIGTITPSAQIKLLKVLQEKKITRVGGEVEIDVDVRIISATNSDLKELCDQGEFRLDLYYRLNVFPIKIPPLRDRVDDIPLLVEKFLAKLNRIYNKNINRASEECLESLKNYKWPGNIREMENLIERAYILENTEILTTDNFPEEIINTFIPSMSGFSEKSHKTLAEIRKQGIEIIEKNYLIKILSENNGKINKTSEIAGITSRQLNKLMNKYNLRKDDYKNRNSQF